MNVAGSSFHHPLDWDTQIDGRISNRCSQQNIKMKQRTSVRSHQNNCTNNNYCWLCILLGKMKLIFWFGINVGGLKKHPILYTNSHGRNMKWNLLLHHKYATKTLKYVHFILWKKANGDQASYKLPGEKMLLDYWPINDIIFLQIIFNKSTFCIN